MDVPIPKVIANSNLQLQSISNLVYVDAEQVLVDDGNVAKAVFGYHAHPRVYPLRYYNHGCLVHKHRLRGIHRSCRTP